MSGKRTALVIGGTGLIGGHCIRQLLNSDVYTEVVVFGRRRVGLAHSRLNQIVGDLSNAELLLENCTADDVYCCLGTTIKKAQSKSAFKHVDYQYPLDIAQIMRKKGSEHFCVVSAVGASSSSRFFYNRVKGELERDLATLNYPYLTILRPSLLTGDRDEFRLGESFSGMVGTLIKPIMKGALLELSPVEAEQVASVMVGESIKISRGLRYQNKLVIKSREIQEYKG